MPYKFCGGEDFIKHDTIMFKSPFCPLCIFLDGNRKLKVLNIILEEIMDDNMTYCRGEDKESHIWVMYNRINKICPLCQALESKGFTQADADKIVKSIKRSGILDIPKEVDRKVLDAQITKIQDNAEKITLALDEIEEATQSLSE